jgi:hypothetical protein
MITKESADALAQVLLEQEQRLSDDRKNAMARRGLWLYRYGELKRFKPWQREVIIRRCAQLANREPLLFIVFGAWLLLALAIAFNFQANVFGFGRGYAIALLGLAVVVFHRWRVRQYVRAFLEFVYERSSTNAG